jgi:riboflavin kinase/FMN adenylyltransferase
MKIYESIENLPSFLYPVVVMGNFDGVHEGHQKIVSEVVCRAREHNGTAIIITYRPNTGVFFGRVAEAQLLSTEEEKFDSLQALGIDAIVVIPFTQEFSQMEAGMFIEQILVHKLGIKEIVVGYDSAFGKGRKGGKELLTGYGERFGFEVTEVVPLQKEGSIISSTTLRKNL